MCGEARGDVGGLENVLEKQSWIRDGRQHYRNDWVDLECAGSKQVTFYRDLRLAFLYVRL